MSAFALLLCHRMTVGVLIAGGQHIAQWDCLHVPMQMVCWPRRPRIATFVNKCAANWREAKHVSKFRSRSFAEANGAPAEETQMYMLQTDAGQA